MHYPSEYTRYAYIQYTFYENLSIVDRIKSIARYHFLNRVVSYGTVNC